MSEIFTGTGLNNSHLPDTTSTTWLTLVCKQCGAVHHSKTTEADREVDRVEEVDTQDLTTSKIYFTHTFTGLSLESTSSQCRALCLHVTVFLLPNFHLSDCCNVTLAICLTFHRVSFNGHSLHAFQCLLYIKQN